MQADEIRVRQQGQVVWMALAQLVATRLWLGGAVSPRRDGALIARLCALVRACALPAPLVVLVDGFAGVCHAGAAAGARHGGVGSAAAR